MKNVGNQIKKIMDLIKPHKQAKLKANRTEKNLQESVDFISTKFDEYKKDKICLLKNNLMDATRKRQPRTKN